LARTAVHARQTAADTDSAVVLRFLIKSGAAYGLSGATPDDLDDAGREMLAEVYAGDPIATAGELRLTRPESLRAGRLVIDLHEKEAPKAVANFLALCTGRRRLPKLRQWPGWHSWQRLQVVDGTVLAQERKG
jgi:hypothetical protein